MGFVVDQKEASKQQEEGNGASFHSTGDWKQQKFSCCKLEGQTRPFLPTVKCCCFCCHITSTSRREQASSSMAWSWYTNRFTAPAKNANLFLNSQMPIFFLNSCPSFSSSIQMLICQSLDGKFEKL